MELSDAEWKVMHALWERAPATVREVHERVVDQTGWAYSTAKTLLTRLVDKGAVAVERRGNTGVFSPLISRSDARRQAVRGLLGRAFGGTFGALISHIVDDERLTARDRDELRALLEAERSVAPRPTKKGRGR